MARYTGPRQRKLRRLGADLPGLTAHTLDERPQPPGQQPARRRRRPSPYAQRLREKQILRFNYGLTERQLRRYMRRAARLPGPAGANLLSLLERRLDNAVYRLGLAPTIPAARQLVRHGHIDVDGRRVSMPGFEIRPGNVIAAHPGSHDHPHIAAGAAYAPALRVPSYLERGDSGLGGRCVGLPARSDVPVDVDERLIVEFYAR